VNTTDRPDERNLISARLLNELVNNSLDPGYAAAARRRGPEPSRRWYDRPAVIVGCLLIGFVLVVAYVRTHRSAPEAAKVHDSLVTRVRKAQHDADRLSTRLRGLQQQLSSAQQQALPQSGSLARQLDQAELAAGQTPVTGPGVTVTLREPPASSTSPGPGRGGANSLPGTNILTDRDVRSVVNELWHDGAEAIAVNHIRLTPTSAIRFAGEVVLVDFQAITSPYHVEAIGDSDTLSTNFAQSSVASRYQTLVSVNNIGFSFTESNHLKLPASASSTLRYARVAAKRGSR
jgi:uncharacterized protein YlxW (UPF0749 family)